MKFHTLRFELTGHAVDKNVDEGSTLDIADEFSRLSRSFGFEGEIDTYAGLWATRYVYDDYSLLAGDFLARGLRLDLLCEVSAPVPFTAIFSCLQRVLSQIATCEIHKVTLVCEPYSVGMRGVKKQAHGDLLAFLNAASASYDVSASNLSLIRYKCTDSRMKELLSGHESLGEHPYSLQELALPISALWTEQITDVLKKSEKAEISIV